MEIGALPNPKHAANHANPSHSQTNACGHFSQGAPQQIGLSQKAMRDIRLAVEGGAARKGPDMRVATILGEGSVKVRDSPGI